jgi:hypothetical protein
MSEIGDGKMKISELIGSNHSQKFIFSLHCHDCNFDC